jgi:mgtE-like transporter
LTPWAIAIYPAILSARGVIGGLLSGRLSTELHLGTIEPRLFGNTKSYQILLQEIVVLTLEASIFIGTAAGLFGWFFWGTTISDIINVIGVTMGTMILALVTITPLTINISSISFRHGLDPDIVLYPVDSTISDLLITLCYFLVLYLFVSYGSTGKYLIAILCSVLFFVSAYFLHKNAQETEFTKTIKESILTLISVAFIVNITGSVLNRITEVVGSRREIYIVYPALINQIGAIGSVVGSTATTKLALGTLRSSFSGIRDHAAEIFGAWSASLIMFLIYSVLSLIIQGTFEIGTFFRLAALLLATNFGAALAIIIVSYAVAILTFQNGLNPDNFVIPIESSFADSITTISLLLALNLIG